MVIGAEQSMKVEGLLNQITKLRIAPNQDAEIAMAFKELSRVINSWYDQAINANA